VAIAEVLPMARRMLVAMMVYFMVRAPLEVEVVADDDAGDEHEVQ